MTRIAHGTRDEHGQWHPDNPGDYPPMDVHGILPWSVLRQDSTTWQTRKRWWTEGGVRDDTTVRTDAQGMMATGRHGAISGGVSRFDPVLAETMYTWLCPAGGHVLDPFAGGPVRGVVAAHLGLRYDGIDLSLRQVVDNRTASSNLTLPPAAPPPRWTHGDARDILPTRIVGYDYLLTCPPYHNRERYSNDPDDLSTMSWDAFLAAHEEIVAGGLALLRQDRFATWIISDIRDSKGHLRDLPGHITRQLEAAGAHLVNEQILVAPVGTAHKRMRPPWGACRTTTRIHQLVLTFVKGDRRAAARAVRGGGHAD